MIRPTPTKNAKSLTTVLETADKKISIALMASFVVLTVQYFVLIAFDLLGTTNASSVQTTSKVLVGLVYLYALPAVIKRSKVKLLGVYSAGIFLFLSHYLFFPANRFFIQDIMLSFFMMSMPAFIYSMSLRDLTAFKQVMKKASTAVFLFGTILGVLIFTGKASAGAYSMSLSYYMLLPAVMHLDELMEKASLKAFLFSAVSILIILALGSRGAILCIGVFIVIRFVSMNLKLTFKNLLIYLFAFGAVVLSFVYMDRILQFTYNFLLNFGIRSRSILLFLRDDVHLSGRDQIYQSVLEGIYQSPLIGVGLGGDRVIRGGSYAHNFYLELLANFGVVMGGVIGIALTIYILKSLMTKYQLGSSMLIIWISLGFVHLMVSGSYLTDIKFWILVGLLVNGILINPKQRCIQE